MYVGFSFFFLLSGSRGKDNEKDFKWKKNSNFINSS